MSKVTLGGDRLGAGNKEEIQLRNYERSTHDLSYIWRSTMASGTLVPFMSEVALPGDTFDIDLECDIKTHPTIGPLFGSYKVQLDVFQCPVRLYNGKLHMNMLNIGMKMQDIKLPLLGLQSINKYETDNDQINASSIFSYLGIRGLGKGNYSTELPVNRKFNALPYLMYWDIYKNYYANKQEELGAVVHNAQNYAVNDITNFRIYTMGQEYDIENYENQQPMSWNSGTTSKIWFDNSYEPDASQIFLKLGQDYLVRLDQIFSNIEWSTGVENIMICSDIFPNLWGTRMVWLYDYIPSQYPNEKPRVLTFPLKNIDTMRQNILSEVNNPNAYLINQQSIQPYGLPMKLGDTGKYSLQSNQEGLALKTYQSDLFNNWISTEWIDGENGINSITAIDTSSGEFSIDTLQLSKKVYDMLNRIAVSGGTYDDWLDAVYTHERTRSVENPMYMGGLIKELAFQEVISNAASIVEETQQPLGTLAGRGVLTKKNKGGKVRVKVDEPSYIIGIISLTPRIDYSQGNKWSVNLKTMDDFHKPALDEIGFQDLITDQMAWWDTELSIDEEVTFKSAGKQPAWINYMTNVNECRGNFAVQGDQMFMTLNRRYEVGNGGIKDLTTYIDPSKFNNIFADTRLDAQNFWAQIGVNIKARRKMSARLMPNL